MTYTYTYTAAELQQHHDTVADGEANGFTPNPDLVLAPGEILTTNLIKTSRLVVQGVDGEPLPTNGTNTNYTAGVEVAFGCVAGTNIVNLTNDAVGDVGNWTADSGEIYFEVDIGPGRTIGDYFGSVMQADGTQLYADDTAGITLTENSGKARLIVDFAQVSFSAWGISEQRGKLSFFSDRQIINALQPELLAARSWQDVTASRAAGVTYTNETNTDIVMTTSTFGNNNSANILIDGITVRITEAISGSDSLIMAYIPSGSTYSYNPDSGLIQDWSELRI